MLPIVLLNAELRRVMDDKLDTSKGFFVQPVGEVRSCFTSCLGTPRQGLLAPSTRARIEFQRSISPDTLDGLSEFSHVWIVFVFHKNTNSKNARAHAGLRSDSHRHTFRAKIAPPRLKERVGIFCTRSPHRPNPIGITLAKIEAVDMKARTVHISGVDLVDSTPVLDIKPYVPGYDCIPDARAAAWVSLADQLLPEVSWLDLALASTVRELAATSTHYRGSPDTFVRAVEEVLRMDVRSKDQTKRWSTSAANRIVIDNAQIEYSSKKSSAASATSKKKKAGGGGTTKKKKGGFEASGPPCLGLYVDALDLKMLWAEAQIIACNIEEKKLKVHFVGWKSRWDIWTDRMSLAAHGTYVPLTKRSLAQPRRWDGKSNLFSVTKAHEAEDANASDAGDALVPLLKEAPPPQRVDTPTPSAAPKRLKPASAPKESMPAAPADAAALAASRKSRPAKIATEKPVAKASAFASAPKRSPAAKSERGGSVTVVTKVTVTKTTTTTVTGKKRKKSPAVSSSGAVAADPVVVGAAAGGKSAGSRSSRKRLKETAVLLSANGEAPVDLAATRQQNVAGEEQTASFLQRCASVWQRQLSAVTARLS
ncbi:hypothetical protein PybrP1_008155 [[Pythium] brassicae (nom. inval.)]|nr:hypothetical protein PybrP1_008155 [[Pythium] brassicae (nom. inval.)]